MHYSDVQGMTGKKRIKYFIVKYAHTVGFRRVANDGATRTSPSSAMYAT